MKRPLQIAASLSLLTGAIVGCGGGGGGGGDTSSGGGSSGGGTGGGTPDPVVVQPDPEPDLSPNTNVFWFEPQPKLRKDGWFHRAIQGDFTTGWDPTLPPVTGMEIKFFGDAAKCVPVPDNSANGGVTEQTDFQADATAVERMGLQATMNVGKRQSLWRPSADSSLCPAGTRNRRGPAAVGIDWDLTVGGMGMYTPTGVELVGTDPLLVPFGAGGQGSSGVNSYILGSFISWRMDWQGSGQRRPWLDAEGNAGSNPTMRFYTRQSVTIFDVSGEGQAKQEVLIDFINKGCVDAGLHPQRPCQVQYLVDTGIVRGGISDWSTVGWFQKGRVSYDAAQGGIPVVSGPLKSVGVDTIDEVTGLPLYTSRGMATQHKPFNDLPFDLRISMDQLRTMMRITTASTLNKALGDVSTADLQSVWGPQWDDPQAWVLLNPHVAQEVYNDKPATQRAAVGGKVTEVWVGRAP